MRLYLAGPMRGCPAFNFPAFNEAAARLRSLGHEVFSPAEREDIEHLRTHGPERFADYMALDLPEVCRADAIAVLPNWEESQGARLEVHVAKELGLPIIPVADVRGYCWCKEELQHTIYGDREFLGCPLHGSAYKRNAEEIARAMPR